MHAIQQINSHGQSIWLDSISRELLESGTLQRYISEFSVTGLTSNPTIFDLAIRNSSLYDRDIAEKCARGIQGESLFFELALEDVCRAADLLLPAHTSSNGIDGWVSIEVSPLLANDTEATIASASSLHRMAQRSNLYIKIPGTKAGFPAIEECIYRGIPINVTLLFSPDHYLAASEAYMRGIERRMQEGLDLKISSVASLFVSRWDTAVKNRVGTDLKNRLGIAMAQRSYFFFRQLLAGTRWQKLQDSGAQPQRLLWASTGAKDRTVSDTYYVEALVATDTVNTLPEKTLLALTELVSVTHQLDADGGEAEKLLSSFLENGVNLEALAARLQQEGVLAFANSWHSLIGSITIKQRAL